MNVKKSPSSNLKFLVLATLLWGLVAPWASAGPAQEAELAEKEFARGDLIAALGLWRKSAQEGFAPAQVRLADMLDKAEEDEEAVVWYRKAATQGDAAGEFGLGQMYAKGEGVKKDVAQARAYVLRAAEQNHPPAVQLMMDAYRSGGLGLSVDLVQADLWEARVLALIPAYKKSLPKAPATTKKGSTK